MADEITIRPTTAHDMARIDALLAVSYPALLKADYPPSVLVTALPLISRAQPRLLRSGQYYLAENSDGEALAAGGWSHANPQGGAGARDLAHIRHVATHPRALRRGLARAVVEHSFRAARAEGGRRMMCLSTRTAVPFYTAMGFAARGEVEVMLRPGIGFPAVEMTRTL